jgi:hypothetical protein
MPIDATAQQATPTAKPPMRATAAFHRRFRRMALPKAVPNITKTIAATIMGQVIAAQGHARNQ